MKIINERKKKMDWDIENILEVVEVELSDTHYCLIAKGSNKSLFLVFLADNEIEEIQSIEGSKIHTTKETYHVLDSFNKITLE